MKYVLKNTAYRGETQTVEEWYMMHDSILQFHTENLSEAMTWDTFNEAADFDKQYGGNEHKVVKIIDKDLFKARLTGK